MRLHLILQDRKSRKNRNTVYGTTSVQLKMSNRDFSLSLTPIHSLRSEAQASEVSSVRMPRRARIFEILKSRKMVSV